LWNVSKWASDTTTQKVEYVTVPNAVKSPQVTVLQRTLLVLATGFQKALQAISIRNTVDDIQTINQFRQRASDRLPFSLTLLEIYQLFKRDIADRTTILVPRTLVPATPERRTANTRNSKASIIRADWLDGQLQGCTPKQGRSIAKMTEESQLLYNERVEQCLGLVLVKMVNSDGSTAKRQQCDICSHRTMYKCLGCKRPLCFDANRQSKNNLHEEDLLFSRLDMTTTTFPNSEGRPVPGVVHRLPFIDKHGAKQHEYCVLSCYHLAHYDKLNNNFKSLADDGQKNSKRRKT
jgi:hypothetical protein